MVDSRFGLPGPHGPDRKIPETLRSKLRTLEEYGVFLDIEKLNAITKDPLWLTLLLHMWNELIDKMVSQSDMRAVMHDAERKNIPETGISSLEYFSKHADTLEVVTMIHDVLVILAGDGIGVVDKEVFTAAATKAIREIAESKQADIPGIELIAESLAEVLFS